MTKVVDSGSCADFKILTSAHERYEDQMTYELVYPP